MESVVVRGNTTLDAAPLDAEFLGAAVRDHGLITPCQATLPRGTGAIRDRGVEPRGGEWLRAADSEILFWTFVNDTQYFGTAALPWPETATGELRHRLRHRHAEGSRAPNDRVRGRGLRAGRSPAARRDAGRGTYRQRAVWRRVGADQRRLHRVQSHGRRSRIDRRLRRRRDGDLPRRWTSGDHNGGQRLSRRPVARPGTPRARRVVPVSRNRSRSSVWESLELDDFATLVPRILVAGAGTGPTLVSCRCT